ncbi:MAG: SsrA-binding protein SmpB [Rickettsiales bacterium]|nr:SsrA-binding protein SmpB [Rickettsiales bacterium]
MVTIAQNKKASFEYSLLEYYEAGIVLTGTEIKSIRVGRVSLQESYADIDKNGEMWVYNMNIPPYMQSSKYFNHDPKRKRKLLLRKKEINKLIGGVKEKGFTIIPVALYINNKGFAKLKIALAKGKKVYDKREAIKKREWEREKAYVLKTNNKAQKL